MTSNESRSVNLDCMWLSEQKPDMFTYRLKFILLPQLITTLNNYASSLPPLANVNWSAFLERFCWPCKSMTGAMAPMEGSTLAVGPDMAPTVSAHLSRPCCGILALVGTCTRHSYSNLYYCIILLLHLSFCHYPPPTTQLLPSAYIRWWAGEAWGWPRAPKTHTLIYVGPILMNSIKNHQSW